MEEIVGQPTANVPVKPDGQAHDVRRDAREACMDMDAVKAVTVVPMRFVFLSSAVCAG